MNSAPDHAALSNLAPAGTLPLALIAAARTHGHRPALRHKRAGIWATWTFADYLAHTAGMARLLEGAGLKAGGLLATVGENRPEFYAAHLAAQALGAAALPLGSEFLRRFGAPGWTPDLVLCDGAEAAQVWHARLPGFGGPVLRLDEVATAAEAEGEEALAWLAFRAASVTGSDTALILHTDGAEGAPEPVALSHAALLAAGRVSVEELGLGPTDTTMAFLPMSGICDAAVSLVQPLLCGLSVHCVEGPATFPLDLREVAPTYLCAPSRVFETLDRSITTRLGAGHGALRALKGLAEAGRPGSGLLFSAPLLNTLGLGRCRVAVVTGAEAEPGMVARLLAYGVPLRTEYALDAAGALQSRPMPAEEPNERHAAAHVEALLRDTPEIERARVSGPADALTAEIAFDPEALSRFLEQQGLPSGEGADHHPAVRELADRRISSVNAKLTAEGADGHIIAAKLLPQGFPANDLTLEGQVRRTAAPRPENFCGRFLSVERSSGGATYFSSS